MTYNARETQCVCLQWIYSIMLLVRDSLCVGLLIRLARAEEWWEL